MKKRTKIIVAIIIIIIILLVISAISIVSYQNKEKKSVDDFINIKEIVEFYGGTYLTTKKSAEEGFKKDIRIVFPVNPISEDGLSNKAKYDAILGGIAAKMNRNDFRVLDETKNLIVRIYFGDGKQTYTINGDGNFFDHLLSNQSIENKVEDKISSIEVNSKLLEKIINNSWMTTNINLGTMDSAVEKYDIYFDEGYKIRKVAGSVYNIVFTKQYKDKVIGGLTTASTLEEVEQALGQATYTSEAGDEASIKGYKTDKFYVFFTNGEISIYPNQPIENQDEFAELVTEYIEEEDINNFLTKLTDIWPDYSEYTKNSDFIKVKYPIKGVEIDISNVKLLSITLYNNFSGKITNDITAESIKENKTIPEFVNIDFERNLVKIDEQNREMLDIRKREPLDRAETLKTDKYVVYLNNSQNQCIFYSSDKENIDSVLVVEDVTNIYELNETNFVYSINKKGIYIYDAIAKQTKEVITGNENYEIRKIENNIIYYNDTQISVKL